MHEGDYFFYQGLYYHTPNSYVNVSTGYESAGQREDYHRTVGLNGQDIQFTGMVNENLPYLYRSPDDAYRGQSPYNPYNPYITGAMIGADGSILVPQQYYTLQSYENFVSSLAYVPVVQQSRPDALANGIKSYVSNPVSVNQVDDLVSRNNFPSVASNTPFMQDASNQRNSLGKVSDGGKTKFGSSKQRVSNVSRSSPKQASTQTIGAGGNQGKDGVIGKGPSGGGQLKSSIVSLNGLSRSESSNHVHSAVREAKQNILYGRVPDDEKVCTDKTKVQNLGMAKNKSTNQLVVKAYTSKAGNPDSQGNITLYKDMYNRVDFPVDYANAMFFVIKSYSEDDVHKSIKYNVWSSTPNGNKKLNAAYEDAQRIAGGDPRGCPVFLFFSVNASGQFCGVAEMIGPVDFDRDMEFWQLDKWRGSFPVKWHMVKDFPNPNFRHVILENNENKPVTNSRDTQEISYKKGLQMLQIFKNYALRTSLFDDFLYYENRQRILQEERSRLLFLPLHSTSVQKNVKEHVAGNLSIENEVQVATDGSVDSSVSVNPSRTLSKVQNMVDIATLPIDEEPESAIPPSATHGEPVKVFATGSNNTVDTESSSILTIGTIPLDLRAIQRE